MTWSWHKSPEGMEIESLVMLENKLWAIKNAEGQPRQSSLMVSDDGGATWQEKPIEIDQGIRKQLK